jgi:hypothetical protein
LRYYYRDMSIEKGIYCSMFNVRCLGLELENLSSAGGVAPKETGEDSLFDVWDLMFDVVIENQKKKSYLCFKMSRISDRRRREISNGTSFCITIV